ncbi:MAG TPA: anti-sigma factor [Bryobacteraceae bacterium]
MSCHETKTFIDAYSDGELDLVRSIELEHHLNDCSACAALREMRRSLQRAVRIDLLRYRSPDELKKRLRAALAAQDRRERQESRRMWSWISRPWPLAAASAAAMLVIAALWLRPVPNSVEREVVDSHVRSLMASHLTDVVSSDQHTVKPWFAGKLDFSPPVRDFAAAGFPLVGGRLDYIDNHAAAAIVYRRNQHVINALVWPVHTPDQGFRNGVKQGYHVIETVHGGMECWIVSDLNADELTQFANLFVTFPSQ